jgi:hypothetical protein
LTLPGTAHASPSLPLLDGFSNKRTDKAKSLNFPSIFNRFDGLTISDAGIQALAAGPTGN